jgi:hypothetical protein
VLPSDSIHAGSLPKQEGRYTGGFLAKLKKKLSASE